MSKKTFIDKNIVVNRICTAANIFKQKFADKTFLILFEGQHREVRFSWLVS